MKLSTTVMERIGVATLIVGMMLLPAIASMHLSPYWMILALAIAWSGAYLRSRSRRAQQAATIRQR